MKTRRSLIRVFLIALLITPSTQFAAEKASSGESPEERDARMQWWREARFGMFVHWGLYSGLAGTWRGSKVADYGGMEWIQKLVKSDTWTYAREAVPHFKPGTGFAKEWAKLAK